MEGAILGLAWVVVVGAVEAGGGGDVARGSAAVRVVLVQQADRTRQIGPVMYQMVDGNRGGEIGVGPSRSHGAVRNS